MKKALITLASLLIFSACSFQQPDYLQMLSPSELNTIMQTQDIFLVDVHTPEQAHIKGTDAVIPYNDIQTHLAKLPSDKSTPIYLYCEGGPMGNAAARTLHELGYTKLFNLDGGTHAWRKAGLALE